MDSILAAFFCERNQREGWWYKIKITPKVDSQSTDEDVMLPTMRRLANIVCRNYPRNYDEA